MKRTTLLSSFLCLIVIGLTFSNCAVVPTCPGNLLPILEIQVNNSASNHDDYGSTTSYTVCQARITNSAKFLGGLNFPGGVAVEIRNPATTSNLSFSTTGGSSAGAASVFVTLPGNGSWFTFYVKGLSTSTLDKSSSIEMATAGASCNEVVLARKALMIPAGAAPIGAGQQVEIEVGSVATLDDYITWTPKFCRIRWSTGTSGSFLNVRLQNMSGTDHLRFADSLLGGGATATNSTLTYNLHGDGSWANFYIAGNFGNASVNDKDAVLEVVDAATGSPLSRDGLMVRIRKNANTLTAGERERYLEALKKLDLTYNDYIDFVKTHSRDNTGSGGSMLAHRQAHSGSAFLPWHRAYVLHVERLLQAADPSVALPYWKFDDNAPNMFTQDFMGANNTSLATDYVLLASTNPIVSWTLPGEGVSTGILRRTPYGDGGHPAVGTETATLALGSPTFAYDNFKTMEVSTHNPAHFNSGSTSWIGPSPPLAVRDPLFFFLHCNVDRLWAKWQWLRNRNSMTDVLSYDLQGSFTTPATGVAAPAWATNSSGQIVTNRTLGQYADDTVWPWDNVIGGGTSPTVTSARPNIAILTPFPIVLGAILPGSKPNIKGLIDYLSITGTSPGWGLGFAYDDFFPY